MRVETVFHYSEAARLSRDHALKLIAEENERHQRALEPLIQILSRIDMMSDQSAYLIPEPGDPPLDVNIAGLAPP